MYNYESCTKNLTSNILNKLSRGKTRVKTFTLLNGVGSLLKNVFQVKGRGHVNVYWFGKEKI